MKDALMRRPMHHATEATNLADILERVLDKGIVIAGDISISLADIELLNIRIRLLVASVDKALEMGINWWESDPALSSQARALEAENQDLRRRVEGIEARLGSRAKGPGKAPALPAASRPKGPDEGRKRGKR